MQFMLIALYAVYNTDMAENSTEVLNGIIPSQESSYTTYEQLEEMSPTLVIVSVCLSETFNGVQFLNESVTVENVSVSTSG